MRLQSSIVAELLLIALVIGIAGVFYYTNQNILYGVSSQVESTKIASNQLIVHTAVVTTPYTWKVFLQNVGKSPIDLNALHPTAYLYKGKELCGASKGFLSDTSTIQPGETATIYFYGFDSCTYEPDKKYTLKVGVGDQSLSSPATLDSSVYLWIPFTSVHTFDFSGKHPVYYHTGTLATLNGYHDGNAQNFNWSNDIVEGVKGEALKFSPSTGSYVVSQRVDLFEKNYGTVTMWVKPFFDWNDNQAHYFWDTNNETRYFLYKSGANSIVVYICNHTIGSITPSGWWEKNRWMMITLEWNSLANYVALYKNGSLIHSWSITSDTCKTTDLYIGSRYSKADQFDGLIDEVRIYNRPLTDDEIKALYRGEDIRKGLVLYYSFDRNTIDTSHNKIYDVHMWTRGGLYFDGNLDYALPNVSFPGPPEKNYVSTTIVVWFTSFDGNKEEATIVGDEVTETGIVISDGAVCGEAQDRKVCSLLTLGKMHFAAISVDANSDKALFFVDGNQTGEITGFVGTGNGYAGEPLIMGAYCHYCDEKNDPQYFFDGIIYEVQLYSRALSPNEIRCIFENPDCLIDDENLIAIYTLDFPDGAWSDVPNWHQTPAAPRIRKDGLSYYFDDDPNSEIVVKEFELYGLENFSLASTLFPPSYYTGTSSYPKDLYFGYQWNDENKAIFIGEENRGGVVPYSNVYFIYNCSSGRKGEFFNLSLDKWQTIVFEWGPERNIFGFLDGSKTLDYTIPSDCNTVFDVKPEETLHPDTFKRLVIGANSILAENSSHKHRFVLALTRRLNSYEINALCKLFGTC